MKLFLFTLAAACTLNAAAFAAEHKVEMKFNESTGAVYFEPQKLEIKSGDSVIFSHADPYNIHNIMFEPQGVPEGANIPMMSPEEMQQGDTWKVTFSTPGTYSYHCHPHYDMGMAGEIIVDHPSTPSAAPASHSGGHSHHH